MGVIQGELFEKIADNSKIFYCHTHDVNNFFNSSVPKDEFVLISHNSDGKVVNGGVNFPNCNVDNIPSNLKRWFGQNVDCIDSRVESIPIGLENSKWFPETQKIEKLSKIVNTTKNIKNLVYLNLNISNNPPERQPIYDMMKDKQYVTTEYGRNGLSFDSYLDNLYNHKFMICPEGNGIDVHQPWESLYVNTIPIQKKNTNNSNWRELPICWLDDWSQMEDESFLNSEYERISNGNFNKEKMYFSYWSEKIRKSI